MYIEFTGICTRVWSRTYEGKTNNYCEIMIFPEDGGMSDTFQFQSRDNNFNDIPKGKEISVKANIGGAIFDRKQYLFLRSYELVK
jgi:hypothetical protein